MTWRALVVWLLLLLVAVLNGAVRETFITPRVGDQAGRALSSLMLACLIILIGQLTAAWLAIEHNRNAWETGLIWLALTLAFEFFAGHFVFGTPWKAIVAEYDVMQGRIWIVVLIATLLSPVLGYRSLPR